MGRHRLLAAPWEEAQTSYIHLRRVSLLRQAGLDKVKVPTEADGQLLSAPNLLKDGQYSRLRLCVPDPLSVGDRVRGIQTSPKMC